MAGYLSRPEEEKGAVEGDEIRPPPPLPQIRAEIVEALPRNPTRIGEVEIAFSAFLDEVQERAFRSAVLRLQSDGRIIAEGERLEGADDGKADIFQHVGTHLPARAFVEYPLDLLVSENVQGRGQRRGIFIAPQNEVVRIEMIHVAVRDQQISDGGQIRAEAQGMIVGVGGKIHGQFPVYEHLRAAVKFFLSAAARLAAGIAVAENGGYALRGARSQIENFHASASDSNRMVTGPSLSCSIFISAPNMPSFTSTPNSFSLSAA